MRSAHNTVALILVCGTLALAGYEIGANRGEQSANPSGQALAANGAEPGPPGANPGNDASNAAAGSPSSPAAPAANSPAGDSQPPQPLTLPEGTPIEVRLTEAIGSGLDRTGQTFAATLAQPIVADGAVVAPVGANVTGRIVEARPSGHLKTPAELSVTLTAIAINGQRYDLSTSDRSWRGRSHKRHDAKWIGGAAGAGALIGALVGHGEGAAIGAGIGAGGGTATAYATGKKNIVLPPETKLRFVLRRPLTLAQS